MRTKFVKWDNLKRFHRGAEKNVNFSSSSVSGLNFGDKDERQEKKCQDTI